MAEIKEGWVKAVNEKLQKDLELVAQAAYDNGCELLNDAQFLYEAHRYSRATALSILAEEELSKAFTLKLSAANKRWDSNLYSALRSHANKQGLAEALVEYIIWLKKSIELVGGLAWTFSDEEKFKEVVAKAKKRLRKPVKDHLKQDALYVSLHENGKLKSRPKDITRADAENSLHSAEIFQIMVALLFDDESAYERFLRI
ncbi:AbiV family abortive infection protein [Methylophilus sp. 3sh_L]|uniref:AbiV family abortive infection protein n=1 Tax=Methylophilus sp. 3sh_L TaxID=3377114 RepID=UPI00398F43B1